MNAMVLNMCGFVMFAIAVLTEEQSYNAGAMVLFSIAIATALGKK